MHKPNLQIAPTSTSLYIRSEALPEVQFYKDFAASGMKRQTYYTWDCDISVNIIAEIEKLVDSIILSEISEYSSSCYLIYKSPNNNSEINVHLSLSTSTRKIEMLTFSNGSELTKEVLDYFKGIFKVSGPAKNDEVPVNFRIMGRNGPKTTTRNIEVSSYDEIKDNYIGETRKLMDQLINYKPQKGGEMFIFSGSPGTGKTFALMSLFRAWRNWASFNYIVDPSSLFGGNPDYIMSVILDTAKEEVFDFEINKPKPDAATKWRVILLEDMPPHLLSADAGMRNDQGFSQLLNVTEGLLGRGLKLLFIISTNEELGKLHEAITRPGRAAVRHEFEHFDVEAANTWLKNKGSDKTVTDCKTIAELYAMINDSMIQTAEPVQRKAGFI